ncbi:MarR family transcriptional regulator [Actinoplanes sp. NPDC023936]|uniref:MarR family winged helix-turn-helix transcriptional regulator n=1 Tax=Actinoplanes sp. NPDC023936 TaxID=3154910 RepID=UPI0033DE59F8
MLEQEFDRQLRFAVHALDAAHRRVFRELDLPLTYPQYLVLATLSRRGPVTVRELGRALRLDSGTLSPLLRRLETAGLVRRVRSADDERSVVVHLTEGSAAIRRQARLVPGRIAAAAGLEQSEVRALQQALSRLTASLDTFNDQ